jgi:hypothetical protein
MWIAASIALLGAATSDFMAPETKGRNLEEAAGKFRLIDRFSLNRMDRGLRESSYRTPP